MTNRNRNGWRIPRRTFLAGAGVSIALPMLEVMSPIRIAKAQTLPQRLVFLHVEYGMLRCFMQPREEGAGYTVPELIQPATDIRDDLTILSGIHNKPGSASYTFADGTTSSDGPGDHARDNGTHLTATRIKKSDSDIRAGISIDQEAANFIQTRPEFKTDVHSLVLGTQESYGGDSGYPRIYRANISWESATKPAGKETNPNELFNTLFGGFDPGLSTEERERRAALGKSVLDCVVSDINSLQSKLGGTDKEKLDQYLTGIRDLEGKLLAAESAAVCDPGSAPENTGDFREKTERMYDMITLAFQCDRTRVASMMLGHSTYTFLGINSGHHDMSHHENDGGDISNLKKINQWQIGSFANLVQKLSAVTDSDGSRIIDNSIVMLGSSLDGSGFRGDLYETNTGNVHRHEEIPVLLAGKGGGVIRPGRHINAGGRPVADLYLSMLHAVGNTEATSFGLEGSDLLDLA